MEIRYWILLTFLGALWGSAFMFIKVATPEFGPIALVNTRLLIASLIFLPILLQKKYIHLLKPIWKQVLVLSIMNNAIPFTLFSYASFGADSNILAILNATTAFNTMIIAYLWIGESVSLKQLFGLILGFIGIFILVNPQNSDTTLIASLSALLAAFFYSYSTVYIQRQSVNANKMVLIGWSIVFSAVLMIPVSIFNLPETLPSASAIGSAFWLGAVSTGIGFLGYVRLIDKIGAVKTSTVAYFLPVFGIIWGSIFLDEKITSTIILGCLIVLIGIYLSNSNKKGYVNSVNTKA
ncbi:DMT family transporter [Gammaproteobacteria bacterium]|nr:DMT family transporter [Gammaproteobacteria bacterium]MDA9805295.1 DMT family transporter [Gammaproteobacteria bacterium]MDA9867078.1 DMT family transporter [Gammaproteobacteria bacterium]MDC0466915.1 DMT family transporter [Gammaproteobacteria bacterium]MDC1008134.1 DMT family transporter [Gammaproteobacteria bacterium]